MRCDDPCDAPLHSAQGLGTLDLLYDSSPLTIVHEYAQAGASNIPEYARTQEHKRHTNVAVLDACRALLSRQRVPKPISHNFLRRADGDSALYSEQLGDSGS